MPRDIVRNHVPDRTDLHIPLMNTARSTSPIRLTCLGSIIETMDYGLRVRYNAKFEMHAKKHALTTNSILSAIQSRQPTLCVLFQPAYVMCCSLSPRAFQTIKALA